MQMAANQLAVWLRAPAGAHVSQDLPVKLVLLCCLARSVKTVDSVLDQWPKRIAVAVARAVLSARPAIRS